MTETNGQAETPVAETQPNELRTRGNIADVTALIQGESNAAAEEIVKRQTDGDPILGDVDQEPATGNGAADPAEAKFLNPDGEPEPAAQDPEAEPAAAEPVAPIESFKQLAEAAGIELSALYDLTINFGDGQGVEPGPVKLGAIKDAYQKGLELTERTDDLRAETSKFEENKLLTNMAIDSRIASMDLTEGQIREQAAWIADNKVREQAKLFEIVPGLRKNAELRRQTQQEIVDLVKPYGISALEVDNIVDHRFYKFAMDAVEAFGLIATARADAKRVRKTGKSEPLSRKFNGKGSAASKTDKLVAQAKSTRMPVDQVSAISALLGNKS